jgi:hypothetical protein
MKLQAVRLPVARRCGVVGNEKLSRDVTNSRPIRIGRALSQTGEFGWRLREPRRQMGFGRNQSLKTAL